MRLTSTIATWIDTLIPGIRARSITRSAAFHSRQGIDFARFPEALIRYRMVGHGPRTLVLATDAPVVIEQYDELLQQLESDFRVIVFEVPGFGYSMPNFGFSFEFARLNNLVAKFLRHLDMGPYLLAFPCVSAYGAVEIARHFPELVDGVVLIQAPSWSEQLKWKHARDTRGLLSTPIIGQIGLQWLKRKHAPQWLRTAIARRDRLASFVETTDTAFSQGACFCLASAFQNYLTDTAPSLVPITQPSLIIWGDADKSHRHTDKLSSKLYCPQARDVHFHQAGHFPELEEPALFADALKEWVRTINT
jgi:pimeloyl-ACP methyl ester carboxylesterase